MLVTAVGISAPWLDAVVVGIPIGMGVVGIIPTLVIAIVMAVAIVVLVLSFVLPVVVTIVPIAVVVAVLGRSGDGKRSRQSHEPYSH